MSIQGDPTASTDVGEGDTAAFSDDASGHHPNSVLLDRKAYFKEQRNATTAVGTTSTGHSIQITFCLAEPPATSHFCIHSLEINETDYATEPVVACSEKDVVVVHFSFKFGPRVPSFEPRLREYFVYRAGRKPSFNPIPYPGPDILIRPQILHHESLGLVPSNDGEFLLVSLAMRMSILDYDLHIFSSKTKRWSTKQVLVQRTPVIEDMPFEVNKVITLGEGVLGWVDLCRGILVCNVLEDSPVVSVIPLPKPKVVKSLYDSPNQFRDVTGHNGLIRFIDMEHLYREEVIVQNKTQLPNGPGTGSTGFIYDSNAAFHSHVLVEAPKVCYAPDGWRLWSYYSRDSWGYWRVKDIVHCDDITVNNPGHSIFVPDELRCYSTGKLKLGNLSSALPSISNCCEDLVYLTSKLKFDDLKAWNLGIHLGKRELAMVEPHSSYRAMFFKANVCPYAFSNYLNAAPGIH